MDSLLAHDQTTDIINSLTLLHADELPSLARRNKPVVMPGAPFFSTVHKMFYQFVSQLLQTWTKCGWGLVFLPGGLLDKISMILFALVSSLILSGFLVWCMFTHIPGVRCLFRRWSARYAGGLGFTNAWYPQIFEQLSDEQIHVGLEALSQPMPPLHSHDTETRTFNLDIAKILFQCSALMYERTPEPLDGALKLTRQAQQTAQPPQNPAVGASISQPGGVLQSAVGSVPAERISASLQNNTAESVMIRFANRLGVKYSTVSDLDSQTSAFCGCFWDPRSTYIILAFRGTSPTDFVEWATDFAYEPVDAGLHIRGFGRVHGGFMERIFPRRIQRGGRLPYDTIRHAVRRIATGLEHNLRRGQKINLWVTGHSLGTALASVLYSRAIYELQDFGPYVDLRDAYLFATPILTDVRSANAFHNRLNHDSRRTMWRVTNGFDVVATGLPSGGDDTAHPLSPHNLFSFSHLGMELVLREPYRRPFVRGNAIAQGTTVRVVSATHQTHGVTNQREIERLHGLERIPFLGRLLAHAPGLYWYMLQTIQPGECEWTD